LSLDELHRLSVTDSSASRKTHHYADLVNLANYSGIYYRSSCYVITEFCSDLL